MYINLNQVNNPYINKKKKGYHMKLKKREFSLIFVIAAVCFVVILFMAIYGSIHTASGSVEDIAGKIVRFHVIANSDSLEDQDVKLKVKEAVIEFVQKETKDFKDVEQTKNFLIHNTEHIIKIAEETLKQNNFDYTVKANLTKCYFPIKSYGDAVFPAGQYQAYRIEIGKAQGKNWWCVLYPPLCFIDASTGVLPADSKDDLQQVLGDDNYQTVCPDSDTKVHFRFKFLTFLNGLFE